MRSEQWLTWLKNQDCSPFGAKPLHLPIIVGVLNITDNSFSDGGSYLHLDNALKQAQSMIEAGVDIIEVGGEASNPGAKPISVDEELARVMPIISHLRKQTNTVLAIDTYKPQVMQAAVDAGVQLINDIYALRKPHALHLVAEMQVPVCLMHMQGNPETMQDNPRYDNDVIDEINLFFSERIKVCIDAGIHRENIILDPGFGFGKTPADNLNLVRRLDAFHIHHCPLYLGASRKSTIGHVLSKPIDQRLYGGLAVAAYAALKGLAMIRTHDVDETKQLLTMMGAILGFSSSDEQRENNES